LRRSARRSSPICPRFRSAFSTATKPPASRCSPPPPAPPSVWLWPGRGPARAPDDPVGLWFSGFARLRRALDLGFGRIVDLPEETVRAVRDAR
jgi:hypothetical protein